MLSFFNISDNIKNKADCLVESVSKDEIVVTGEKYEMDAVFLTKDDTYIHFEFQTTLKKEDLPRFLVYDALLYSKKQKQVNTYVVYTNQITKSDSELDIGGALYRVNPIYMGKYISEDIVEQLLSKEKFDEEDKLKIALIPVMGGNLDMKTKLTKAIQLSEKINKNKSEVQGVLYLFAHKFLKGSDYNDIMEVLKMTELGKAIFKDGEVKGKAEGKAEGMDLMIKVNKLTKERMSKSDIAKKCKISEKEVDEILDKLKELI